MSYDIFRDVVKAKFSTDGKNNLIDFSTYDESPERSAECKISTHFLKWESEKAWDSVSDEDSSSTSNTPVSDEQKAALDGFRNSSYFRKISESTPMKYVWTLRNESALYEIFTQQQEPLPWWSQRRDRCCGDRTVDMRKLRFYLHEHAVSRRTSLYYDRSNGTHQFVLYLVSKYMESVTEWWYEEVDEISKEGDAMDDESGSDEADESDSNTAGTRSTKFKKLTWAEFRAEFAKCSDLIDFSYFNSVVDSDFKNAEEFFAEFQIRNRKNRTETDWRSENLQKDWKSEQQIEEYYKEWFNYIRGYVAEGSLEDLAASKLSKNSFLWTDEHTEILKKQLLEFFPGAFMAGAEVSSLFISEVYVALRKLKHRRKPDSRGNIPQNVWGAICKRLKEEWGNLKEEYSFEELILEILKTPEITTRVLRKNAAGHGVAVL